MRAETADASQMPNPGVASKDTVRAPGSKRSGSKRERRHAFQRRVALAAKSPAGPLNPRQCRNSFAQFSGRARRNHLTNSAAIAVFVTCRGSKVRVRLPAKAQRRSVETLVRTR